MWDTSVKLTKAQAAALEFADRWGPLRDGSIEQGLQLGLHGAALDAVIAALEKKKLVDATGAITVEGKRVLATAP